MATQMLNMSSNENDIRIRKYEKLHLSEKIKVAHRYVKSGGNRYKILTVCFRLIHSDSKDDQLVGATLLDLSMIQDAEKAEGEMFKYQEIYPKLVEIATRPVSPGANVTPSPPVSVLP